MFELILEILTIIMLSFIGFVATAKYWQGKILWKAVPTILAFLWIVKLVSEYQLFG